MSSSRFADGTVQVSWVLSRLDDILRLDTRERTEESKSEITHGEVIRQAIQSMKSDIVSDHSTGIAVRNRAHHYARRPSRLTWLNSLPQWK